MPRLIFTNHLNGIAPSGEPEFSGRTVAEVLAGAFAAHPGLRHYILDDQGRLRKHVVIFVDNARVSTLAAPVAETSEIYVLQALSGGWK